MHQFVCFNTVFNHDLLGPTPANVELNTLSLGSYFEDLGKLCTEKKIDVLFRGYPLEQNVDFPLHRQVVEIPDIQHEYFPEFFDAECLRSRRAAFNRVLGRAGAIGTISEFARQTLLAQPALRRGDIFLMCPALQNGTPPPRRAHARGTDADPRRRLLSLSRQPLETQEPPARAAGF